MLKYDGYGTCQNTFSEVIKFIKIINNLKNCAEYDILKVLEYNKIDLNSHDNYYVDDILIKHSEWDYTVGIVLYNSFDSSIYIYGPYCAVLLMAEKYEFDAEYSADILRKIGDFIC